MALPQSPSKDSRARYAQSFSSRIFEPLGAAQAPTFIPAGKRRDQTTQEMFGTYNDKELRAMPKTFVPKQDRESARQKKQNFLSSDVLPHTAYCNTSPRGGYPAPGEQRVLVDPDAEDGEGLNPHVRRQVELSSDLFGRETPNLTADEIQDVNKRLTPNDFKWFNVPEPSRSQTGGKDVTYQDRAYHEKCSNLFDHRSPQVQQETQAEIQDRQEEAVGDLKRRANVYYSDLFGRNTPMAQPEMDMRRNRMQGEAEDQIIVHQDWTDSRTELMTGARKPKPETPACRKSDEFNQQRIFVSKDHYAPPQHMNPVTTDNSNKVKQALGHSSQEIHQAHLRSSLTPDAFYEKAANNTHWEVIELHISGLRDDADEDMVKNLCKAFDLQIVKVNVEMDPVRNLCKGRAKIMVRYNPLRDSIAGLVQRLQETKLRVEL